MTSTATATAVTDDDAADTATEDAHWRNYKMFSLNFMIATKTLGSKCSQWCQ